MFANRVHAQQRPSSVSDSSDLLRARSLPLQETIHHAFGHHSLADIRVHSDSGPRRALDQVGRKAVSIGPDVFLGRDAGLRVAAHEAAHVVQQRRGMTDEGAMEDHAERVAERVANGLSAEELLDDVGTDHAGPRSQLLFNGGPLDVKSTDAAKLRKKAFDDSRKKVQKLFKKKKTRKKLSKIVGMEITSADATSALTIPVVFESEVMHGLSFTDKQASGLDKKLLKKDRQKLWDIRAKDAQAFFQTGEGLTTLIKQPMIGVLDEAIPEPYQDKTGFTHNLGNTALVERLIHEYVHAAIYAADKRRKKTMYAITEASYKAAWRDKRVAALAKVVPSATDRDALRQKLLAVGALKPKGALTASSYERPPIFFGTDEEKEAKRKKWDADQAKAKETSDLRELVLGLVRFEKGHGLKRTGKYDGKTKTKLDDLATKYIGGSPASWIEHKAMKAVSVEIASGSDKP